MNCPICKDIMIFPRLYPQCGHTLCEPCMIKHDTVEREKTRSVFDAHIYSCPICRQTTLLSWSHRPINRLILQELRNNDAYEEAYNKYKENRNDITSISIPNDIDLAIISKKIRLEKTEILYKEILILLFEAASNGKPYITISTKSKVHDIQLVADLLSTKLFKNNKIYKLTTTPNICDIEIIPSNRTYKSEYINPEIQTTTRRSRSIRNLSSISEPSSISSIVRTGFNNILGDGSRV